MASNMPKPRQRQVHPIRAAVERWTTTLNTGPLNEPQAWRESLINSAPKRFTVYEPMVLLPSGSFSGTAWVGALARCDVEARERLWRLILDELSKSAKTTLTNLAINGGIPLQSEGGDAENVLRSPSRLKMLFGDFGPAQPAHDPPSAADFDAAFWVSTKQNGIYQTWAPRWTMFSRGNVKEKARLLEFPRAVAGEAGGGGGGDGDDDVWALDLYAGIGYFVLCYAALGMRVLCWEINPWSVEGLRRGARANGRSVRVVQGGTADPARATRSWVRPRRGEPDGSGGEGREDIIVFLESNEHAASRVAELQGATGAAAAAARMVWHVNCGYLPSSEPTWRPAWEMARWSREAWLHLHENVGAADTETRRDEIQRRFTDWGETEEGRGRSAAVEHVELVKTFAPGVWHCVFDVHITRV
ncbi:tRNA(Phe) (4-demethylwyosine(37)-C(7)) aminocarboxypropyltransferase [Purpureocillium takamizusanense]|uniref:tRNA wybutosine-synthesizing protein 2 n=1 Tax=Purpureocillium takamizusanense TaxID=2060973 RepID=A0A9Q8QKL3_9HYPO|nr:tRNA(Phe) (4-demethylwyosine(37)-C(7)) aminocarboxypropyltransferase [Purpureocillium takamizusanense]UNI20287.1 tRNA(Phe) (4-demethylwyosine(37)-C(7)) aminocarboxypropyltransferase [Purpureocillium takamizusanense]